jgi:hypothetical protein
MKIGVTGTRSGMTELQKQTVTEFLQKHNGELHHGDCIGVDVEVANIAKKLGYKVVCHPPIKDDLRAFFQSDEYKPPLSYFARNRKIVDDTDILLVVPYQNEWQSHGGTWYTHDYAKKKSKPLTIFYPGT